MRKKPSPPTPNILAERQATLRGDARFSALLSAEPDTRVTVTLWLIELDGPAGRASRLLWGWVLSARRGVPSRWSTQRERNWSPQNDDKVKCRHARLSLTADAASVEKLLTALGDGRALGDAATDAALPAPETFGSLSLGATAKDIAERFVLGPVRFLAAGQAIGAITPNQRPLASASDHSSFSASLCRLHKTNLWHKIDKPEPLAGGDEMARASLTYLEAETGLAFRGADARRFGDIEWISAPATDLDENEYVDITAVRERDLNDEVVVRGFAVTVRPGPLPAGTPIILRCRLFANQDIVADECHALNVGDPPIRIATTVALSRFLVTIWKPADSSSRADIWYEEDNFLIRRISIGMGLMGMSGTLSTEWSRAIERTYATAKQRVTQLNKIAQVHYNTIEIGADSALETAERDMKRFTDGLFPPRSGARFFEKGWFASGGVEFVTWFRQQTEASDVRSFVLVDPFFDDVGLTEFFSRAKNTAVEYVAITSSQVASFDDANSDGTKSTRRDRLLRAFASLAPLFDSLNITVFDINKQSGGTPSTTQVFHDRYLLIYGADAELLRGFHLSNSIQGATKNAPLLITPIPSDVLPQVSRYVAALKAGDSKDANLVDALTVEQLASSAEQRTRKRTHATPTRKPTIGLSFFEALLGGADRDVLAWRAPDDVIRGRAFGLFETHGKKRGFQQEDWLTAEAELTLQHAGLAREDGAFVLTPDIAGRLPSFIELLATNEDAFARWWSTLCFWRWRLDATDDAISAVVSPFAPALLPRWERFIIALPRDPTPHGTKGTAATQSALGAVSMALSDFDQGLRVGDHFDAFPPSYGADAKIRLTLEDVAAANACTLVDIAEQLVATLPALQLDANSAERGALGPIFDPLWSTLADHVRGKNGALVERMLKSSLPSMRAIGGQSIVKQKLSPDEIARRLEALSDVRERLYVLAERVSDLRVEANRNGNVESDAVRQQLDNICAVVVAHWPQGLTADEVKRAALALGGPGVGAWAQSTLNRVLAPLVDAGRLSWIDVTKLWGEILFANLRKLERVLQRGATDRSVSNPEDESGHVFYFANDGPLSDAFTSALTHVEHAIRMEWTQQLEDLSRAARLTLHRPFVRSRNYSAWAAARDLLDWVSSVVGLVLFHGEDLGADEKTALRAARERDLALIADAPAGHNDGLTLLRSQVDDGVARVAKLQGGASTSSH